MLRREITAAYFKKTLGDDKRKTSFVVQDRDFFGKPASVLKLCTIAPPTVGTTPVSDLLEVTYEPMEKDNRITLTRRAKDFHFEFTPDPYPQMEDVEGFLVECWDGSKWVKSWDTALNNNLPKSVKVTVRIKERDKTVEYSAVATPQIDFQ
jgi:general secretion pathway protein J